MTPDLTIAENRKIVKDACEKTIRCAQQRGSSTPRVQHSQDVIEDVRIMLAALEAIEKQVAEVNRLREVEADYTYVLNNLQWSNIGTGQGWVAKGIGGHTWTTAEQIRERRKAAEEAKSP